MARPALLRRALGGLVAVSLLAAGWGFLPAIASRVAPALLYYPAGLGPREADPAEWGLPRAEEAWIRAGDGVRLHAWWLPAAGEAPARGTVIYFHGNAGHLAARAEIARRWAERGVHVLLFDYRGYGRSEGSPSEAGLYRDGRAAYRHVRRERGEPPGRILLHGHSLGAAVAVKTAAGHPAAGLLVSAGFSSVPSLASRLYGWLPGRAFEGWTRNRFDSRSRVGGVEAPVLIVAGGADRVVEAGEVRRLYEAAAEPKRWLELPDAGHNDLLDHRRFWEAAEAFAADALADTDP